MIYANKMKDSSFSIFFVFIYSIIWSSESFHARHQINFRHRIIRNSYNEQSIKTLQGLEAVRKRPGMYIGSTGQSGLDHLIFEIVDNSVDEAIAGFCKNIRVVLYQNGSAEVSDDGRGIPCGIGRDGKSTLETVLCTLHSGGKFGGSESAYKVSGGLHGVGLSVVNALSTSLSVEVTRDNNRYAMSFSCGNPISNLTSAAVESSTSTATSTSTKISFMPDPSIFKTSTSFDYNKISSRLDEICYLVPGLAISITDLRESPEPPDASGLNHHTRTVTSITHQHTGGLPEMVSRMSGDKVSVLSQDMSTSSTHMPTSSTHMPTSSTSSIHIRGEKDGVEVEAVLTWLHKQYAENTWGFVNCIRTHDGGTHIDGLRLAISKALNSYPKKIAQVKSRGKIKDGAIPSEYLREALTAVVHVKVPEPEFEGQTKTKLGNPEVRRIVDDVVHQKLLEVFEWNPKIPLAIRQKAVEAQNAAVAAKSARELIRNQQSLAQGMSAVLPGKLSDCSATNPVDCEIFVVEGDSAAGSAKQGRDRTHQAILPLRGKIMNVLKSTKEKVFRSTELQNLVAALGLSSMLTAKSGGDEAQSAISIAKLLRYHKIVLMTDADVDGSHIRLLILTFLHEYFPDLIGGGYVYIACPPLYQVAVDKSRAVAGSIPRVKYLYDVESYERYTRLIDSHFPDDTHKYTVQRFKGLGEMMPEQLWSTTMDPASRLLKRVCIEDVQQTKSLLEMLMGDAVAARKDFISEFALQHSTSNQLDL